MPQITEKSVLYERLETPAGFRNKRLKYAVGTSLLSKVMTAIVQIVALPIAFRALGNQQFILYAMLSSAVGWLGLAKLGIGPVLVVRIAEVAAQNDRLAEKRLFISALVPILMMVFLMGIVLSISIIYAPIAKLFGPNYYQSATIIKQGISILVLLFLLQTVLSVIEAAQLGYQEQYLLNIVAIASHLVCIVAILIVAKYNPSVIWMILAVNVPPFLFRIANATAFFIKRSFLMSSLDGFSWSDSKALIGNGVAFSLAGGLGNFLCHQFPVMMMGRVWVAQEAASFTVAMNALVIASGMISMITISLWPAISDSIARGEIEWTRRVYRRILLYCMVYGTSVGLFFTAFGSGLFRLWYGPSIQVNQSLSVFLGLYFALLMIETAYLTMLIGMNLIILPSILYLSRSIMALILMSTWLNHAGTAGPFISLCLSLILTIIPFILLTQRAFRVHSLKYK